MDFHRGECTFCTECVSACEAPVFRPTTQTPWGYGPISGQAVWPRPGVLPALSGRLRAAGHPLSPGWGAYHPSIHAGSRAMAAGPAWRIARWATHQHRSVSWRSFAMTQETNKLENGNMTRKSSMYPAWWC